MKQKLQAKDLINIGIFTALYIVSYMAIGMLGYIPIFMVLLPLLGSLVAGIPFSLYLTKVYRFGMITITGTMIGLLMFATGHPWPVLAAGCICGLLSDLIMKGGKYTSWKHMVLGYIVFSEWSMGALMPFFFMRDSYFATIRAGYGDTYADTLMAITPMWVFYLMFIFAAIGAIGGAYLGKSVLKKHFKKAGIV